MCLSINNTIHGHLISTTKKEKKRKRREKVTYILKNWNLFQLIDHIHRYLTIHYLCPQC